MPGRPARSPLCVLGRDIGDLRRQDGKDLEAYIHDDLRDRRPGRHRNTGVPGYARVVPICSACLLAYTSHRRGRLTQPATMATSPTIQEVSSCGSWPRPPGGRQVAPQLYRWAGAEPAGSPPASDVGRGRIGPGRPNHLPHKISYRLSRAWPYSRDLAQIV